MLGKDKYTHSTAAIAAERLSYESMTALGSPVVPLEKRTHITSSLLIFKEEREGSLGNPGVSSIKVLYDTHPWYGSRQNIVWNQTQEDQLKTTYGIHVTTELVRSVLVAVNIHCCADNSP